MIGLCMGCGYIYRPEVGNPKSAIPADTSFDDLPDNWHCPDCGAPKNMFTKQLKPDS